MKFIDTHHDHWHRVDAENCPVSHPLLSLAQWHAVRESWPAGLSVGLELSNDIDVEDIAADLPLLSLIALSFPAWTDGRAYSQARLLRSRYRFHGEVRATGEVLVDMLPLLARTGFDAVQLRADQKPQAAQRALSFFSAHYQGDVREPRPLFGKVAA